MGTLFSGPEARFPRDPLEERPEKKDPYKGWLTGKHRPFFNLNKIEKFAVITNPIIAGAAIGTVVLYGPVVLPFLIPAATAYTLAKMDDKFFGIRERIANVFERKQMAEGKRKPSKAISEQMQMAAAEMTDMLNPTGRGLSITQDQLFAASLEYVNDFNNDFVKPMSSPENMRIKFINKFKSEFNASGLTAEEWVAAKLTVPAPPRTQAEIDNDLASTATGPGVNLDHGDHVGEELNTPVRPPGDPVTVPTPSTSDPWVGRSGFGIPKRDLER